MSPITYAIHADQHLLKKPHQCSSCNQKYSSYLKYYTEDFCGDNAIPKNVKMFVNNTVAKLKYVEEDTEIIGENFSNHYTSYAKRHTINELPRDYKRFKKSKFVKSKSAYKQYTDVHDIYYEMYNYIPETTEEWIINIPTMLDARVSLSVVDKQRSDKQLEEEFEWVYDDGETEKIEFELKSPNKEFAFKNFCTICKKSFATVSDLDQHSAIHKVKVKEEPVVKTEVLSPRHRKLPRNVTTIICADCDACSEDCDHSDHGIMLRRDSIAEHVARTGHQRCRVAGEIRPETDCKVTNIFSLFRILILNFPGTSDESGL